MAFNIQGFSAAAKGMGYNDDEIAAVAAMASSMPQSSGTSLLNEGRALEIEKDKILLDEMRNPKGFKPTGDYTLDLKTDLETGGKFRESIDNYYKSLKTPESAKQEEAKKLKDNTLQAAKAVQTVLDNKESYSSEKEYKDALKYAASRLSSATGFGEGGKALTGAELGILSGSLINIKPQRKQNLLERITGDVPPATGEVLDDEETIRNKMNNAISYLSTGKVAAPGSSTKAGGEGLLPRIQRGAGKEIDAIGKSLKDMYENPQPISINPLENTAKYVGGAAVGLGTSVKNVLTEPGYAVDHPLETTGLALPFLPKIKSAIGGAKNAVLSKAAELTKKSPEIAVGGGVSPAVVAEDLAGRAATDIAVPDINSVVKSESLMKQALQQTKSNTVRGIAKELEQGIATDAQAIEKYAKTLDDAIGPQPLDEVVNQVMAKVAQTPSAKANPQLLDIIEADLKNQLMSGDLEGGLARGEPFSTNISSMNTARKYFTSGKNSWFSNGQPVGNPTNDLQAMQWETANGLKEIMAQADEVGKIKDLLNKQHVAFQTYPVLSKKALSGAGESANSIIGTLRKAFSTVATPVRVGGARSMQGPLPSIGGDIESAPSATLNSTLPAVPRQRIPLEPQIIEKVLKTKGPAQAERMMKDMGLPTIRKDQEKFLRKGAKKKYR
jgi:hypothetical protein